jgi:hypothetical protein
MKSLFMMMALAAGLTVAGGSVQAQPTPAPSAAQQAQQDRMKSCNATAGTQTLAGDARKTFMSDCLSGKAPAPVANTQQEKMKTCNAQAGTQKLAGDARKAFMSTCLKG